jgi:hypothetical protein
MAVGLDELCRIHSAAMEACGDIPTTLGASGAERLKNNLDTAARWALDASPVEALAVTVVSVLRAEAFQTGNYRTALLLAAVLIDRSALPAPADWMGVADGLVDLDFGNLSTAVQRVVALLGGEPR